MQLDFHFSVTYLMARMAGFDKDEAYTIAYSSQHVDDAVSNSKILFDNDAAYIPICSAHKALDYRNFDQLKNHEAWIPFHFLPGNCNYKAGEGMKETFASRIVCLPNSIIAQDMVAECIKDKEKKIGLYRLGITMHVYADTWAHQGFCGISNKLNKVSYFNDDEISKNLFDRAKEFFKDIFNNEIGEIIDEELPLGHGAVLSYPDLPFLKWKYKNSGKKIIIRDNAKEFTDAAEHMYHAMQRYRIGDSKAQVNDFTPEFKNKLMEVFRSNNDWDGKVRNNKWLKMFKNGTFDIGKVEVQYDDSKWKKEAIEKKFDSNIYKYDDRFMDSNWKLFNDALKTHYFYISCILLPNYGICIA